MSDTATAVLEPWANFYVMTGSAAAALTGLMFVVITLASGNERIARNPDGVRAFSTPTVLHFGAALFVAAMLLAPWRTLVFLGVLLGVASAYGFVHLARVTLLVRRVDYEPDAEDWTWYTALPLVAYAVILVGAILLFVHPVDACFAFAAGAVGLIFIGIHNAWDVVTYITLGEGRNPPQSGD